MDSLPGVNCCSNCLSFVFDSALCPPTQDCALMEWSHSGYGDALRRLNGDHPIVGRRHPSVPPPQDVSKNVQLGSCGGGTERGDGGTNHNTS